MRLDPSSREKHVKANEDLCVISLPNIEPSHFVRGTLPVEVSGLPEGIAWGVWAEVSESIFDRILELWSDPDQASVPPFAGRLANVIPSYPGTLGLPLSVHLTGPTTRPEFYFGQALKHLFVQECRSGVDLHRAAEWNRLMGIIV